MNVLVTGAGGFVCRSIVNVLLTTGYKVIALDQSFDADLRRDWGWHVTLIEGDTTQLPDVPVDAVVHGAAITASPEENDQTPEAHFRANMEPLLTALEWAQEHHVRRFLTISSGAVYSRTDFGPRSEEQPPTPDGLYAVAKSTMEALITTLHKHYQRDAVVIRLGNVYGPGERSRATRPRVSLVQRMLTQAFDERQITLTSPDETREWTYTQDIGRVVHALLNTVALPHALYNVASGQIFTDHEIAKHIQMLLPGTAIRVEQGTDETVPSRRGWLSNDRLQQDIGFESWTPFASGLAEVIAHRQEQL